MLVSSESCSIRSATGQGEERDGTRQEMKTIFIKNFRFYRKWISISRENRNHSSTDPSPSSE